MKRLVAVTALAGSGLLLAACGGGSGSAGEPTLRAAPTASAAHPSTAGSAAASSSPSAGTPLYLVDANTNNALGESLPAGILAGVKGTIPGVEDTEAFKQGLLAIDPNLKSFTYAAEGYDAVILAALGAATANSDAGVDVARQLVPITNGTEACFDYAGCLALVEAGSPIDYNGRSGAVNFSATGDPTSASIGIYSFGPDNRLQPDVDYRVGEIRTDATGRAINAPVQKGAGDGVWTVGTTLPVTGNLDFMGPPELAGVKLALQDIEAAGGIPGFDRIVLEEGDSGDTSTDTGQQTVKRLLSTGIDVLIGAASSGSTQAVLTPVTNAGVLMISPANTATALTTAADHGLYWRVAPSDVLQGAVLGSLMLEDGHPRVAILARRDPYGAGVASSVEAAVSAGGGEVVERVDYDPVAGDFAAAVARITAKAPNAIVLIGGDESSEVIAELMKQGIGPQVLG